MSNFALTATCASASVPASGYVYAGMLQNAASDRLAIASVRVSSGGVNTLTKPIHAELYRVLTASISGGSATSGTVAKRNVLDSSATTGITCQSLTSGATVTSPELLDSAWYKPDGGSWMFSKGYFCEPTYTLFVKVTDANGASAISTDVNFDIDK
jgi:hypothetical protein